jgi:1,4-alpha-glucan branching enzyme
MATGSAYRCREGICERINTDSEYYGGSNVGNGFEPVHAEQVPAHGREWSLNLTLPPLAALYLEWIP